MRVITPRNEMGDRRSPPAAPHMDAVVAAEDGRITHWSAGAQALYQRPPEEALGERLEDILGDDWLGETSQQMTWTFRSTSLSQGIATHARKDGEKIQVHVTAVSIDKADGCPDLLVLVRQLTKRLRAAESGFRFLAEHSRDGIVVWRLKPERKLEYLNQAMTAITGYSREEFRSDPSLALRMIHPEDRSLAIASLTRTTPFTLRLTRKDGATVWVEIHQTPIQDEAGDVAAIESIVRDISERKREQEAVDSLQRKFLSMITHELKTPLTSIKGAADRSLEHTGLADSLSHRQLLEIIREQSDRLIELVDELLDMSQIEAGVLRITPAPTDLRSILEQVRQTAYYSVAPNHNIVINVPASLPPVQADSRRISQALINLIANAAHSSPPTASITIDLDYNSDYVTVRVRDKGRGIPKEKLPSLFDKFSTINEGESEARSGLGLAIAKGIIEGHGGRIWADSAGTGYGSVFSFTLPVAEVRDVVSSDSASNGSSGDTSTIPSLILTLDNDRHLLRYLHRLLNEARFEVLSSRDPDSALQLIRDEHPHLVITDLRFPGIDGFDLIKRIREFSAVPIIVLTVNSDEEDVVRALTEGADDYITKPFSPAELIARIDAVLRRRGTVVHGDRPSLTLGDLQVNLLERRVTVAGRSIRLTAKEFKLLYELASNSGLVLTHEQLLERVWGHDYRQDTQLLHSFVYNLRRKLGDHGPDYHYIITEPRVGYRMQKG